MAQAREIKSRIANVKDVKQITKAMNAISMAKVTRLKRQLAEARPFWEAIDSKLQLLLQDGLSSGERDTSQYSQLVEGQESGPIGVVAFNSDRGLSGRFTVDINRSTRDFIRSRREDAYLYAGGEKASRYFRKWDELENGWVNFYQEPEFNKAEAIGKSLLEDFYDKSFKSLWVVYMKFHSDLNQDLRVERIFPLASPKGDPEASRGSRNLESEGSSNLEDYLFEPDRKVTTKDFLEEWFLARIFWIMLNSKTSEHAIRRKAMRDATENADELIEDLTLSYNKARQQQITREIADIIGGAEALREED